MNSENENKKKSFDPSNANFAERLCGILCAVGFYGAITGDLNEYFDGFIPVWKELPSLIGVLLSMAVAIVFPYAIGVVLMNMLRENLFKIENKKVVQGIELVLAIILSVLVTGFFCSSCGGPG